MILRDMSNPIERKNGFHDLSAFIFHNNKIKGIHLFFFKFKIDGSAFASGLPKGMSLKK